MVCMNFSCFFCVPVLCSVTLEIHGVSQWVPAALSAY